MARLYLSDNSQRSGRRQRLVWRAMLTALIVAAIPLFCGVAAAAEPGQPLKIGRELAEALRQQTPRSVDDLRAIQMQVQKIAEQRLPATVAVFVGNAVGSGVVVGEDGLVMTVAHVMRRPGQRAWVLLSDGRRLRGKTLGADRDGDAGMIQIDDPPDDLPFAPITTQQRLERGEWVVTIGHPRGPIDGRDPPVRLGRVLGNDDNFVRTDCELVSGDSGGPLFNMRGEVVGIHSSIGEWLTQNFHVPISTFRQGWDRMLAEEFWGNEEMYPVLGVAGRTEEDQCLISQVFRGGPAYQAGLQRGDIVIAANDEEIESFEALTEFIQKQRPGRRIRLQIKRAGTEIEKAVRLGAAEQRPPDW